METRTNRKLFLIVLLSLSVVLTGCSRQLYTMLVSSEDESPRSLASLSGSPSNSESLASQQSQSKSDDLLQGRETAQIVGADNPVEGLPLPTLRDPGIEPSLAHSGQVHKGADLQSLASNSTTSQNSQSGNEGEFSGPNSRDIFSTFQGEFGSMVPRDGVTESLSSASDDITPLDDQDLFTEMEAASGTSGPTGSEAEAFSSPQKGMALTPLGDEFFGEGNLGDVFFDFDAVAIRSDAVSTLHANAQMLKARFDNRQVVIEGHCDERGTAEYNLVLGERRAQTTKQYLVDLGVSSAAIQTISYGKEKPFCTASQPDCWKMNRRGHFVVQ